MVPSSGLANLVRCSVCWMVPFGCDLAFCVVWLRFRMLHRFLAYRPGEVPGCIGFWSMLLQGALVMVLPPACGKRRWDWFVGS